MKLCIKMDYWNLSQTIIPSGKLMVKDIAKHVIIKCNSKSKIADNGKSIMGVLDERDVKAFPYIRQPTLLETIDKYIEEMEHED